MSLGTISSQGAQYEKCFKQSTGLILRMRMVIDLLEFMESAFQPYLQALEDSSRVSIDTLP